MSRFPQIMTGMARQIWPSGARVMLPGTSTKAARRRQYRPHTELAETSWFRTITTLMARSISRSGILRPESGPSSKAALLQLELRRGEPMEIIERLLFTEDSRNEKARRIRYRGPHETNNCIAIHTLRNHDGCVYAGTTVHREQGRSDSSEYRTRKPVDTWNGVRSSLG